jgi:septum formation protein
MSETILPIVLASASPRRVQLLAQLGHSCEVRPQDIDETQLAGESPLVYVQRMAREKAAAVDVTALPNPSLVLAADTVVALGDAVFSKPANLDEALATFRTLSGRTHIVRTALCLMEVDSNAVSKTVGERVSETRVTFCELSPERARRYWESGEPEGKAGAYAIQGLGAQFVQNLEGSYSGVMGLPLFETAELLGLAGVESLPHLATETYE